MEWDWSFKFKLWRVALLSRKERYRGPGKRNWALGVRKNHYRNGEKIGWYWTTLI